tara:strand:- start:251 stop:754 length:504 start_codon:yes stop_codon:yes gene_type:complete
MATSAHINFKIQIPDEFEVDDEKFKLSSIKDSIPSDNYYPKINLLVPDEESSLRYHRVSFNLSPETFNKGTMQIEFVDENAIISCNGDFNFSVKSEYQENFSSPDSKWCFSDLLIGSNLLSTDFDIAYDGDEKGELIEGIGVEEFSYEHRRLGTVDVKILLIDVTIS